MTQQVPSQQPETQVEELSTDQLEQVAGGGSTGGVLVALGDGSVRIGDTSGDGDVDGRDFLLWRKTSN